MKLNNIINYFIEKMVFVLLFTTATQLFTLALKLVKQTQTTIMAQEFILSSHSKSLYNITQAPGWSEDETDALKLAIKLYGVGCWNKIMHSGILPGKTTTQMYMQTQRLLGQQSIGALNDIHLDVDKVTKYYNQHC